MHTRHNVVAGSFEQHPVRASSQNGHRSLIEVSVPAPEVVDAPNLGELSVQLDQTIRHITVRGELDLLTVPILADAMALLIDLDPGDATLDFAGVSFIDAAGLGCLVGFANQLRRHNATVSVTGASLLLRRVFDTVQLGSLLQAS